MSNDSKSSMSSSYVPSSSTSIKVDPGVDWSYPSSKEYKMWIQDSSVSTKTVVGSHRNDLETPHRLRLIGEGIMELSSEYNHYYINVKHIVEIREAETEKESYMYTTQSLGGQSMNLRVGMPLHELRVVIRQALGMSLADARADVGLDVLSRLDD